MTENSNLQFDSYLGGSEVVPKTINISEFLKNRLEEVIMLTETINESPFKGQTFQRLPKHMRRRQMSHHIKRLPRKLQRPYIKSVKEILPSPSKQPSRKYRRRPRNLLLEYNRRQKSSTWLETHIWHAKRFHMIEKWGYKLPEKPTNKSFKACYRAISEHCLLTDISYYNCIELEGCETLLLDGLKQCTSSDCGLTFAAKMYLNGTTEGSVTLYHPNSYPFRVIGNISFMWQPGNEKKRKLWIWVHPLIHEECIECFRQLFSLKPDENKNTLAAEKEICRKKSGEIIKEESVKLIPKNVPFDRIPKFVNIETGVIMSILKNTLNRFRLIGPLSQAIISDAFNVLKFNLNKVNSDVDVPKKKIKLNEIEEDEGCWWLKYYTNEYFRHCLESQSDFYKKLSNYAKPTDMPSGLILSLVVTDPRLNMPVQRKKAIPNKKESDQLPLTTELKLSESPIWNAEVRDKVSLTKLTTHEINLAKSKKIVPGFVANDIILENNQSRIPLLLVQRPGNTKCSSSKLGLGSGWDIISPANFGMPIWLSLIFLGARVGGTRDLELLNFECNNFKDFLQPDSAASEAENQRILKELKNKYFQLPPNKRPNYMKLGIISPFYPLWKILTKDWIEEALLKNTANNFEFSILRNKQTLWQLSEFISNFSKHQNININKFLKYSNCLVPVVIEFTKKGRPSDLALICVPNSKDLETKLEPNEPLHVDGNEKLRKILKARHVKLLKLLRRKRKKEESKLKEEFSKNLPGRLKRKGILKSDAVSSHIYSKIYNEKMKDLWVPKVETIKKVVFNCSRKVLGFVVKGSFSLSKSCGVALGYVTLLGLIEAVTECKNNKSNLLLLVRNQNQSQYHFGKVKIGIE